MRFDIDNKTLEDILKVTIGDVGSNKDICTNKIDRIKKNKNIKYYPLVFKKDNKYEGFEKKISHYYKNISKYNKIGIENVDQYLCIYLLEAKKLYGKEKKYALWISDYIINRNSYIKMGFVTINEYLNYKLLMKKYNNDDMYSILLDYTKNQQEYFKKGIFSLQDFILFNKMVKKSLNAYQKSSVKYFMDLNSFLEFELREFSWKKQFYNKNNTLSGVQLFLIKEYKKSCSLDVNMEYYNNTGYFYDKYNVKNYSEYYELIKNNQKKL